MPPLSESSTFDGVVFAGGGCRCFWQAGFWSLAAPSLGLSPRYIGATSAGAALACAASAGSLERVLDTFKSRIAANPRNVYPRNWRSTDPVFPHESIYRQTIQDTLDEAMLARIHSGPDLRILLSRPPLRLGARSSLALGMVAYQLDRWNKGARVHPVWGRRFGFQGDVVSVRSCRTTDELAELILQSSCTPPLTPYYRRNGHVVLDGGLVDGVPVEAIPEARSKLVLLAKHFAPEDLPRIPGRTYVAPSRTVPVEKWDYTSPDRVQATWDLGRRDAEAFVEAALAGAPMSSRTHRRANGRHNVLGAVS